MRKVVFKNLVLACLKEGDQTQLEDFSANYQYKLLGEGFTSQTTGVSALRQAYEEPTELTDLKQALATKYGSTMLQVFKFDNFYAGLIAQTRPNASQFVNMGLDGVFPLADFFYLAAWIDAKDNNTISNNGITRLQSDTIGKNALEQAETQIVAQLKKTVGGDPLFDYTPISPFLFSQYSVIRKAALGRNGIGPIVLTNFENKGIKEALLFLLELRRKGRLRKLNTAKAPPDPKVDIERFFQDPIGVGTNRLPGFEENYDAVSARVIIEIINDVVSLYQSEITRNITDPKAVPICNPINPKELNYKKFYENELSEGTNAFDWLGTNKKLYRAFLPETTTLMPGGYTIKNIQSLKSPEANDLIKKFTNLADFVSTADTKWLETAADVAGALKKAAGAYDLKSR